MNHNSVEKERSGSKRKLYLFSAVFAVAIMISCVAVFVIGEQVSATGDNEAKIEETGVEYATIGDALAAVGDVQTVQLLKDCTLNAEINYDIPMHLAIDAQGHTLTVGPDGEINLNNSENLALLVLANGHFTIQGEINGPYPVLLEIHDNTRIRLDGEGKIGEDMVMRRANPSFDVNPEAVYNLTYNGAAQKLITPGTLDPCFNAAQYSLDGVNWSPDVPTGTDVGQYTVKCKVDGNQFYVDLQFDIPAVINKATPDITTPRMISGLVYNGGAQALAGGASNVTPGEFSYSFDGKNWSADIPTGIDAGSYLAYYRFVPTDTTNYRTINLAPIMGCRIYAYLPTVTLEEKLDGTCQGDNAVNPATVTLVGGETYDMSKVTYRYYDDALCSVGETAVPPKNAGTYYAVATVPALNSNYLDSVSTPTMVVVKHVTSVVEKEGTVAKHWDCSGCHKHFLDEDCTLEYVLPSEANGKTVIGILATTGLDTKIAKADISPLIDALDTVLDADPNAKIAARILSNDVRVETVAVDTAQIKTLADGGVNVMIGNLMVSAEFPFNALRSMDLTSGDFEFSSKAVVVPEKYRTDVGVNTLAVDINLNVNGSAVTEFGIPVEVVIDYLLPSGYNPEQLRVYHIGENGLEPIPFTYDEDGKTVSFKTSHFSEYTVGVSPPTHGLYVAIGVIASIIVVCVIGAIAVRKN